MTLKLFCKFATFLCFILIGYESVKCLKLDSADEDGRDGAWLTRAFNQDLALPEQYNKHLRPQHKGLSFFLKLQM